MKILILANNDVGLYKFRKELVTELLREHAVIISLPYGKMVEPLIDAGCTFVDTSIDRRGTNPLNDFRLILFYKKIIKQYDPDLVLTYTIKPNVYGGLVCSKYHIPYFTNVTGLGTTIENGGLLAFVTTFLYRIGLKKANCVFFQNKDNRAFFIDNRIVTGHTKLIPGSGVNLKEHKYIPYPENKDGTRFLFVGRIMKDKGIEELLSAIDYIHSQNNSVILDIVGFCDEDYVSALKIAEEKGLIRFHGLQEDVRPFYQNACCTILPSYHEGMANVLLESSATGRPVIASRIPGCLEAFDEGITGFGCEPKSTDSLIDAMDHFLSLSHEEMRNMGVEARKKMEKEFDRQLVIDSYYEEIVTLN